MNGKGDKRRPTRVSKEIADLRWDLAFGDKKAKTAARKRLKELESTKDNT